MTRKDGLLSAKAAVDALAATGADKAVGDARTNQQLRFAVICADDAVPRWQAECVRALVEAGEAELAVVLTASAPPRSASSGRLRRLYESAIQVGCRALDVVDPAAGLSGIPRAPLTSIRSASVDFALVLGAPGAAPGVLDPPPLGLWRFRFGGLDDGAGELPFFREIACGRRALVIELVATMLATGEARLLHRLVLKARRSHRLTLETLAAAAPALCLGACRRVCLGALPTFGDDNPAEAAPPPHSALRAAAAQIARTAQGGLARLFLRDVWTIGILDAPVEAILSGVPLPTPRWLDPPRPGRFHADPFPLLVSGRDHLLFEMYDFAADRGWIAAAALDDPVGGGLVEALTAIDVGCHMSYPSVFDYGGATYCAPEMSEVGGLHLFRMGATARDWTPVAIALEGMPILDPALFEHAGRWWLLATLEGPASDIDLHAWHAETPFGPWMSHALNPVKSDVRSARSAGAAFRAGGALYRPAQDCTWGYGEAVVVNRITRLDPNGFEEVKALRIRPDPDWPWPHGLHTFNVWGDRIVIDARHRVIAPLGPLRRLLSRPP